MTFYETLARILEEKGMTAAELSAKTGIGQPYFSRLKSGRTKDVTWEKALTIIAALEMTPNEFYDYAVVNLDGDEDED